MPTGFQANKQQKFSHAGILCKKPLKCNIIYYILKFVFLCIKLCIRKRLIQFLKVFYIIKPYIRDWVEYKRLGVWYF